MLLDPLRMLSCSSPVLLSPVPLPLSSTCTIKMPHMHRGTPQALHTTEVPRELRFLPQKARCDEHAGGGVCLPLLPPLRAVPGGRAGLHPHIPSTDRACLMPGHPKIQAGGPAQGFEVPPKRRCDCAAGHGGETEAGGCSSAPAPGQPQHPLLSIPFISLP